jgi:hypothetical protein
MNQKNSVDMVHVVNDYCSWILLICYGISTYVGVQRPIISNHHSCVPTCCVS